MIYKLVFLNCFYNKMYISFIQHKVVNSLSGPSIFSSFTFILYYLYFYPFASTVSTETELFLAKDSFGNEIQDDIFSRWKICRTMHNSDGLDAVYNFSMVWKVSFSFLLYLSRV